MRTKFVDYFAIFVEKLEIMALTKELKLEIDEDVLSELEITTETNVKEMINVLMKLNEKNLSVTLFNLRVKPSTFFHSRNGNRHSFYELNTK